MDLTQIAATSMAVGADVALATWVGSGAIALARTCAHLAAGVHGNPAPPVSQELVVHPGPPVARIPSGVAAALGADTDAVIREFGL